DGSSCGTRLLTRLSDGVANFFRRALPTVRRQIGSNETAFATSEVAFGASRTTKENRLSILRISRQGRTPRFALKKPQILDQRSNGGSVQSAERRHPASWNAVADDLRKSGVSAALHLRGGGDVC